jgi:hypothetical protein
MSSERHWALWSTCSHDRQMSRAAGAGDAQRVDVGISIDEARSVFRVGRGKPIILVSERSWFELELPGKPGHRPGAASRRRGSSGMSGFPLSRAGRHELRRSTLRRGRVAPTADRG